MPWKRHRLRDAEVWAEVDAAGALITDEAGRVAVVYKREPNAKVYRAAGRNLGAAAGLVMGKDLTWSSARARLVWLGALLGGVAGFGGSLLIGGGDGGSDFGRAAAGITLAGTWGGFALATHLTRDMRTDRRYRAAPMVQLAPMAVPRGAGLGVAGAW